MPKRWVSHLIGLAAWLGGACLIGFLLDAVSVWLAGALAAYVAYTLRNLYLLDRALSGGRRVFLFEMYGLWAELQARIDRVRIKSRGRKKRFNRLLREVRQSTGALSDAGIILNADREIVWFNPAATRLLGLDPGRDIGHRIDNLIRHPAFVDYLAAAELESAIQIPSPIDDAGTLAVQLIPYGQDQKLTIIRDVTHETHLERTRRDFVANASHELRSPLTVIAGYLDTLADDDELPESWQEPITEMLRQANRMTQILRDLIELTRLESAEGEAQHEFVDVGEMLKAMVAEFAAQKRRPRPQLILDSDAALLGNESELHSIFFNLISNAVRFTPETGSVTVTWRSGDGGALFVVKDTGIGIAAEQIPRLTERFYRVDTSRSRATGGTGLGLAIVKHALQRHGGRLTVESHEGEGSCFTCHFPLRRLALRGGMTGVSV